MLRTMAILAAGTLALSACDQQTGGLSRTGAGAGLGVLAGAAIGSQIGSRPLENALIGAGIGALAGGLVGNFLDDQQRALQQDLQGTGVQVQRVEDRIVLNVPNQVTFDFDSATIRPDAFYILDSIANTLRQYEQSVVYIYGHTDSTGSAQYNQQLSERRATAVANYLASRGVQPVRLQPIGMGQDRPIASNATPEGRAANRRVEIQIVPFTQQ